MKIKYAILIASIPGLIASGILAVNYVKNGMPNANGSTEGLSLRLSHQCFLDADVIAAQEAWGDAIVDIGDAYTKGADYTALAVYTIETLYGYDEGTVLFKPTKASDHQFRVTEQEAISYFVTGSIAEDTGFALHPWSKVRFENERIITNCDSAIAMGNYYFTDANTGNEVKVEYTFGYQKDENGMPLINIHHSSLPYPGDD